MDVQEAVNTIRTGIAGMAWHESQGHPDEVRAERLSDADALALQCVEVVARSSYSAGYERAMAEVGGQLGLET